MKGKQQQDFRVEKYIRYGIRKYSFGAASVAIAAGLMFLGNGAVSATEVQSAETTVAATLAEKSDQNTTEVKPEIGKTTEAKTEVKAEETKKVNKAVLEASITTLESKLSTTKNADPSVIANAREALATAKAVLANEAAKQEEVDIQKDILSALGTVVTESNKLGLEKEQADKDKVAKAEAERNATPTEKAVSEATTVLTQVSSEADVTNTLAATELRKKRYQKKIEQQLKQRLLKTKRYLTNQKYFQLTRALQRNKQRLNQNV